MVAPRVEVSGLNEILADLRRFSASSEDLTGVNREIGQMIVGPARQEAPVVSGDLRASIGSQATSTMAIITGSVPYAGPIHFGWSTRGLGRQAVATFGTKSAARIALRGQSTTKKRAGTTGLLTGAVTARTVNKAVRQSGVRGGPIRPNPFIYRVIDPRRDDVYRRYEQHMDALAAVFNR